MQNTNIGLAKICNASHRSARFRVGIVPCSLLDKRTSGDTEGAGIWGNSLGAISHIKLNQAAFGGSSPVSLVPPVSLLVSLTLGPPWCGTAPSPATPSTARRASLQGLGAPSALDGAMTTAAASVGTSRRGFMGRWAETASVGV